MAVNLNIVFTARANVGRVGNEIKRLGSQIAAAHQQMAAASKQAESAMAGVGRGSAAAVAGAAAFTTQTRRMAGPMEHLTESIRRGNVSFKELRYAIRSNGEIAQRHIAQTQGQVRIMRDLGNGMVEASMRTQHFSQVHAGLAKRIGVTSQAFTGFSNNLINRGKNLQWAGRQIMVGIAVPLLLLGHRAVSAAEEYDRAMTRVLKVTEFTAAEGTEAFVKQEHAVRAQIRALADLGTQMGFTSGETATAAGEFSQMGFQGKQLDIMTNAAQRLAFTSGTELPEAIELSRIVVQAFGIEMEELVPTFARLNMIENNTALSLEEMAESLPVVAAVAHNLGIEIAEVAGLMAMMKDAGIDAKEGATALRTGLLQIVQQATPQAVDAFGKVGLSLEAMRERHRGDTLGFLVELGEHLTTLTDQGAIDDFTAAISKLMGVRQSGRVLTFLREIPNIAVEGTAGFRAWTGAMADSTEAMAALNFEEQQVAQSAAGTADRLRAEITTLMEQAGHPLLEFMNTMRQWAVNILEWFNGLSDQTQRWIKTMMGLGVVSGFLIMIIGVLGNLTGQFMRVVSWTLQFATGTRLVGNEQSFLEKMMARSGASLDNYSRAMTRAAAATNLQAAANRSLMGSQVTVNASTAAATAIAGRNPITDRIAAAGPQAQTLQASAVPIKLSVDEATRSVGTLKKALNGLGAAVGIGTVVSLIEDARKETLDLTAALTKIPIIFMTLGPLVAKLKAGFAAASATGVTGITALGAAVKALLGPVGWVVAAVGLIGGAIWKVKRDADQAFEDIDFGEESAERLAEQLGLAWSETNQLIDSSEAAAAEIQKMRTENAGLIDDLKSMNKEQRQARLYNIGMELVWKGNDPEAVKRQLEAFAQEAGVEVDIDFDMENFDKQRGIIEQSMKDTFDRIAMHQRSGGLLAALFGENTGKSLEIYRMLGEDVGKAFQQGTDEGAAQAGMQWDIIVRDVMTRFPKDVQAQTEALEAARQGMVDKGIRMPTLDTNDFYREVENMETQLDGVGDLRTVTYEFDETAYLDALKNIHTGVDGVAGATNLSLNLVKNFANGVTNAGLQTVQQLRDDAIAYLDELETRMGRPGTTPRQMDWLHSESERTRAELKQYEMQIGAIEGASRRAADGTEILENEVNDLGQTSKDAVNALKSAVQGEWSLILGFALEDHDAITQAGEKMWQSRLDSMRDAQQEEREELKKTQEADKKALKDRYNEQIEALNKVEEEEDELERQRKHHFNMEKMRRDYMNRQAQGRINIRAALYSGNLDEAARIQQEQRADYAEHNQSLRDAELEHEEETQDKRRDAAIESLEAQRDAAVDTMEAEQEAATKTLEKSQEVRVKQVEAAREAYKQQRAIARRAYERELDALKDFIPRNEKEQQDHMARLAKTVSDHGGDMARISANYKNVVGRNITDAFDVATGIATRNLANDARWIDAGEAIGEQIIAGLLGIEYIPPKPTVNMDTRPQVIQDQWAGLLPGRAHTGGFIASSNAGPGLKPGETRAILQTGEYVMDRKTVDRYGPEFFRDLQRYHQGGLVDHLGDMAPLLAMSRTLGEVLAGRRIQETGNLGAAIHKKISGEGFRETPGAQYEQPGAAGAALGPYGFIPGLPNLQAPDRDATWRETNWRVGMKPSVVEKVAGVLAGIPGGQVITSALRRGAKVKGTDRDSLHGSGRAVDIGIRARREGGTLATEREGDRIAAAFRATPGIKEVLWKTMKGGNHYDHVHAGFYHNGGLVGGGMTIPALKSGASVNFDNTLANLHRGETVLTAPLSAQLQEGIAQLANGGGTVYDIDVVVQGNASQDDADSIANAVLRKLEQRENRMGRTRRVG